MSDKKFINPSGFPEYLPETQMAFEHLKHTISKGFNLYGFEYIETPAVEYLDTLSGEGDINKEVYAITRAKSESEDGGVSDRGLRFDLTTPFARYVAQHQGQLTFPFKRYQVDRVWRGERPQKGRYRELYQADVDIVTKGELPLSCDGEILSMIATTLDSLDLVDFTIRVNNREFLKQFVLDLGINETKLSLAFNIIDKLAKVSREKSLMRLVEECELELEKAEEFLDAVSKQYDLADYSTISDEFAYLYEASKSLELKRGKIIIDLSIVRGLDYYTGFVFETTVNGHEDLGSISSGGRYANLVGRFSNQEFPGVGGSIGLSRLFFVLQELQLLESLSHSRGIYVVNLDQHKEAKNQQLANYLRSNNVRCEVAHEEAKFGKQAMYAEAKRFAYLAILEDDGTYSLKNIETREQVNDLSLEGLLEHTKTL
jgi:histidyl-tRNA synthetase